MTCIDRSKVFTPKNFPGAKSQPTSHNGQGSGKMSSAHGTGPSSPTKAMRHASNRIGEGKKGFGSSNYKLGPCAIGRHGKVSTGYGDKAPANIGNGGNHNSKGRKGY